MSDVTRTEIRGQCEKGHVVKGEVFGPELPDEWMDSCPLPDCGHEIVWQRRPDYLAPAADGLASVRESHVKGYRSTSDEAWNRRPICTGCRHEWPCDVATVLAALDQGGRGR
jgi:hypothetical protein